MGTISFLYAAASQPASQPPVQRGGEAGGRGGGELGVFAWLRPVHTCVHLLRAFCPRSVSPVFWLSQIYARNDASKWSSQSRLRWIFCLSQDLLKWMGSGRWLISSPIEFPLKTLWQYFFVSSNLYSSSHRSRKQIIAVRWVIMFLPIKFFFLFFAKQSNDFCPPTFLLMLWQG